MFGCRVSEQRFIGDDVQYLPNFYLIFIPFEYQNSFRLQDPHTFIESSTYIRFPRRKKHSVFLSQHDVPPNFLRCGGSNTTSRNDSSSKGIARKSPTMSGSTLTRRPSQAMNSSRRISINRASEQHLSNHIIRAPQHASRIFLSVFIAFRIHLSFRKSAAPPAGLWRCRRL